MEGELDLGRKSGLAEVVWAAVLVERDFKLLACLVSVQDGELVDIGDSAALHARLVKSKAVLDEKLDRAADVGSALLQVDKLPETTIKVVLSHLKSFDL